MADRSGVANSASQRLEACLRAVARHEARHRAFINVLDAPEAPVTDGSAHDGLLAGMPVAIKDAIDVAGQPCTVGSALFRNVVPIEDAPVIQRLRSSGAVIVGKTNLHELCFGGTTQNPWFGACRNAWDSARLPGGSSGGSAVAVALGMAEAALGTDTGASIRLPAALNGVTGLRPTHGAVSNRGTASVCPIYDTTGPMARRASDVAAVFEAISAHDPLDPCSDPAPRPPIVTQIGHGVAGLRVLVPDDVFLADADAEVQLAVEAVAGELESLGTRLVRGSIAGAADVQERMELVLFAHFAARYERQLAEASDHVSPEIKARMAPGLSASARDLARASDWLSSFRHRTLRLLAEDADMVLTPTTPFTAPPADEEFVSVTAALSRFCWPWSAAGVPAVTFPCGFDRAGLPIGAQLAAGRWRDGLVLRTAHAYQQSTDWHLRQPAM